MSTRRCESIYCLKAGAFRCIACPEGDPGAVYYCSEKHQKEGWPLHKSICKHPNRATIVDGYRLCDAVWKANDAVQTHLTNKHYDRIESVSDRDRVIHTVVEQYAAPVEEVVEDGGSSAAGEPQRLPPQKYRIVDTASEYGNLNNYDSVCAYWAYRSMCSTFTLNNTLFYLLQAYQNRGYKTIVFRDTEIPLEELELAMIQVEPMVRVHNQQVEKWVTTTLHLVSVGGYGIDVSAGRFWIFERGQRPLLYMKKMLFVEAVGKLKWEYDKEAVARHLVNMFKNQDNVLDGASLYKLAMAHLGLSIKGAGQCPEHFRAVEPRLQHQKLTALCTVVEDGFADKIEQYVLSGKSPLAHMANAAHHCIEDLKSGVLALPPRPISTTIDTDGEPPALDDSVEQGGQV